MSDMVSSIQTIVICSGTIIASAILLWCLWKTFGYVGFPIGKMFIRIIKKNDPENTDSDNHQSALIGVFVGGFVCYSLTAYKTISNEGTTKYSVPGREIYDIGFWLTKCVLSGCGETVAVLAILSGVVKALGLDGGKEAFVDLGKDEGRKA